MSTADITQSVTEVRQPADGVVEHSFIMSSNDIVLRNIAVRSSSTCPGVRQSFISNNDGEDICEWRCDT
jgi:hypothetical protein